MLGKNEARSAQRVPGLEESDLNESYARSASARLVEPVQVQVGVAARLMWLH
jgi:hypothetical protein